MLQEEVRDTNSGHETDRPATCQDEVNKLAFHYPGIIFVTVPSAGKLDIVYNPKAISRTEIIGFADTVEGSWTTLVSRCTVPLQGRACETCAVRIQNRLLDVPGVSHATASFLNGSLSVVFDAKALSLTDMLQRIRVAGAPLEVNKQFLSGVSRLIRTLDSLRAERILVSTAGIALLCGFLFDKFQAPIGLAPAAWTIAYITAGYSGVRAALRSLRMGILDIDLLMVLAAIGAAFIGAPAEGAVLLFLFALSNLLQSFAVGKARRAIAALMDMRPEVAVVRNGDALVTTPIDDVRVGQIIVLRPGDRVPMDGIVTEGFGSINQAPITGESIPVEKKPGDEVFTSSLNQEASLEVRVTKRASESTLARMISLVEAAQSEKATTQKFLEKAEQYYAGGVIALTLMLIFVPPLLSLRTFADAFYRAMTVMVVASPCALILSTPAVILSAVASLGRSGILVKGGKHLEDASEIRAVAMDKTGTLTVGKPTVTDLLPISNEDPNAADELLSLAAQAESLSEHPLAKAVVAKAKELNLSVTPAKDFTNVTGRGGETTLANGDKLLFGSLKLMHERGVENYCELEAMAEKVGSEGKSIICLARKSGDKYFPLGILGLQDILRPGALEAIQAMRDSGIERIAMLTGDSPTVANAIAMQAGITEVYAGLMPEDKVRVIKEMAEKTPVLMVGDGTNDAPALAAAHMGMAMGAAGSDVAMETADVVLMSHEIQQIPYFLAVSRKTRRIVNQNLIFATSVIFVLLITALTTDLKLTLGVLGHEGSTVLVCLNGLRMLRPLSRYSQTLG